MQQKDPCIAIVGAGPAGLLTAHYLQNNGYKNVVVLEKLGRIGGLCKTISADGHSFDLGANYVTPDYHEILKLAKKLGTPMYSERPFIAMTPPDKPDGKVTYQSIFNASRRREDGSLIPLWQFGIALIRYTWIRWKLRKIIDKPTFAGVANYDNGSLCVPLEEWLNTHKLTDLNRVFQLPITLMGFGELSETAAIYALKFMTVKSFVPMVLKEAPLIGRLIPWPKRFLFGYQRFFARLSWDLDVRTNVDIQEIDRKPAGIRIVYNQLQQDMDDTDLGRVEMVADYLIFACPLKSPVVFDLLNDNGREKELFQPIQPISYCMTTRSVNMPGRDIGGASPLAAVYPVPKLGSNVPYGVAKQWSDSQFTQFYTRTKQLTEDHPPPGQVGKVQKEVEDGVTQIIRQMGGKIDNSHAFDNSFNRFEYFQHLSTDEIKGNWYDRLEALQGRKNTYFVGGATNFELIEPIASYARNLVHQNFPKRSIPKPSLCARISSWFAHLTPRQHRCLNIMAALLVSLLLIYHFCMPLKSVPIAKPIATSSPLATEATNMFWDVIHADDASSIDHLIEKLTAAYELKPGRKDATLNEILGGTHLWRFHLRARINSTKLEQIRDLRLAVKHGNIAISLDDNPTSTAPSLTAAAEWELAVLEDRPERIPELHMQTIENSLVYPQFAGFVQGWIFAAMFKVDGPYYRQALEGYHFMMTQCGGFPVPDNIQFNKLIHTFYGIKSIFEPVCYNNQLAPHSIEGTFIGYGDAFLKSGDIEKAKIWYENTKTSPTYATWKYKDQLEYRLSHLEELSKKFAADAGKVDVSEPAMNFQSDIGCGGCHTR